MSAINFFLGTLREFPYALRTLRFNPVYSVTVVLTLALGIGATTAIFTVVNGVVIKPLSYPDSERVVTVTHSAVFGGERGNGFPFSPQMLEVYGSLGESFESLGLVGNGQVAVTGGGDPQQADALWVSAGTLPALGVQPQLGRWISAEEDRPGVLPTAVLSDGYWQQRFGGDPRVIGSTITVDGTLREVIGVMPPRFGYGDVPADLFLPLQFDMASPPADFSYQGVARLKPGVTLADANNDIGRMLPLYLAKYAGNRMDSLQLRPAVRPLKEDVIGNVGQVLWVLLASISILLLIACANVTNLLLVRTETRETELAVRSALGAGTGHLARALIAESLSLSLLGGLIGAGLAWVALQLILALGPANLPRLRELAIDPAVAVFVIAISVLSGLLFSVAPMLRLRGGRFAASLGNAMRGGRRSSPGRDQYRSQNALVVAQVALALVLLIASGLMIRTFVNLRGVEPGFTEPETVQAVEIVLPYSTYQDPEPAVRLQRQVSEQLEAIPGITSVAYIDSLPMAGGLGSIVAVDDKVYASDETPPVRRIKMISPGYLQTVGTTLIAGRDFAWVELEEQRNVAMVSESFARAEWGTVTGVLGRRILVGTPGNPWQEVIGVVADVYDDGADRDAPPTVYWPARLHPFVASSHFPLSVSYVLRTDRTGTDSLRRDIRRAVSSVAPDLPIAGMQSLSDVYDASMARTAFSLVLLGIAGTMSLAISIVGIYGVLAYAVMQRRAEVGVRMALGAVPGSVAAMFLRRGMLLAGLGIVIGTVIAVGVTRLMASQLFGVAPVDGVTFAAAIAFLALAGGLACYLPARRAAALDPAETLRSQ